MRGVRNTMRDELSLNANNFTGADTSLHSWERPIRWPLSHRPVLRPDPSIRAGVTCLVKNTPSTCEGVGVSVVLICLFFSPL